MNSTSNRGYISGLDGLRALAIFFIVAYHYGYRWAGGGFLGVDIFFVLSGYLITSKILSLMENNLQNNIKKVWSERIRRLVPAVYLMMLAVVIWTLFFNGELFKTLWKDAISSIFFSANWWFIFHKVSYFDSFGMPSPLKHLWFLAVQEQFLFIFPIVLITGLKDIRSRVKFSIIVFSFALCSAILMGFLYNPDTDPSRVYYGTDTRSFELLLGCCAAMLLPLKELSSMEFTNKQRIPLTAAGIVALAAFILGAIFIDEYEFLLYRGGIFLFNLNIWVLIICICYPASYLGGILSWKPLRWVGSRAYGIYLWHYPVMVLSTPVYEIGNISYWRVCIQLIASCLVAEITYRYLEQPVRKLGFREYFRKHLSIKNINPEPSTLIKNPAIIAAIPLITALAFLTVFIGIIGNVKSEEITEKSESFPAGTIAFNEAGTIAFNENEETASKDSKVNTNEKYIPGSQDRSISNKIKNTADDPGVISAARVDAKSDSIYFDKTGGDSAGINENGNAYVTNITGTAEKAGGSNIIKDMAGTGGKAGGSSDIKDLTNTVKKDEADAVGKGGASPDKNKTNLAAVNSFYNEILAIGDSIMLDIEPYLGKVFSNITIDGKVSRQMSDAIKLAPVYSKFNSSDKAVIIELGTNGYFSGKQIDNLLNYFTKAHIYLINTRVPRPWERKVNEALKEKADERENVELIDWYSTAVKHPEYFGRDGVHLKGSGSEALTNLISYALNSKTEENLKLQGCENNMETGTLADISRTYQD